MFRRKPLTRDKFPAREAHKYVRNDHCRRQSKGRHRQNDDLRKSGIGLANKGKHVLLVDTDPQASLTIALGYPRPDDLPVTLTDLMTNVIQERPVNPEETILSHTEGVDLIPASIMLSGLEVSLVNAMSRETVLK